MVYKIQIVNLRNMDLMKNNIYYISEEKENLEIEDYILLVTIDEEILVAKVMEKILFFDGLTDDLINFVEKLDLEEYKTKLENKKKLQYIEKVLEEKTKKINKYVAFENLAKYDKEAEKMFEEYKNLLNIPTDKLLEDTKKE